MGNSNGYMDAAMKSEPDYRYENERLLLRIIKEKIGITEEDMYTPNVVKEKVRQSNIEEILS